MKKTKVYQKNILLILSIAIVITFSSISLLLYHFEGYLNSADKLNKARGLASQVVYFDEGLTMSARMYTIEQDPTWLERYDDITNKLDSTLINILVLEPSLKELFESSYEVNNRLMIIEKKAMNDASSGRTDQARDKLFSSEYSKLKLLYAQQIEQALKILSDKSEVLEQEHKNEYNFFVFWIVFLMVIFIFIWIYLLRFLRVNTLRLNGLITTDDLTGLKNRRSFDDALKKELRRSIRDGKLLMLAVLDIDYFKQYNDRYGHPKGDIVLSVFGQLMQKVMRRASEYGFRLGGEEFAVITVIDKVEDGLYILNKLKEELINKKIEHKGNIENQIVTFSAGVAIHYSDDILTDEDLYINADRALYKAKKSGRNKIIVCSQNQESANDVQSD